MFHIQLNEQITEMQGVEEREGAGGEEARGKSTSVYTQALNLLCVWFTSTIFSQVLSSWPCSALLGVQSWCRESRLRSQQSHIPARSPKARPWFFALMSLAFLPWTPDYLSRSWGSNELTHVQVLSQPGSYLQKRGHLMKMREAWNCIYENLLSILKIFAHACMFLTSVK